MGAFTYACGFLIISLYDGKYGVSDFTLLKAKAFVAGMVFDCFLIIPTLLGLRSYGLFGLGRTGGSTLPRATTRVQERCVDFIVLFGLYFPCAAIAGFSKFLFAKSLAMGFLGLPVFADGSLLSVLVGLMNFCIITFPIFVASRFQKHFAIRPVQCAILNGLTMLLWFIWLLRMGDSLIFELAGWLYLISVAASFIGHHAAKPSRRMKIEWEWLPLYLTSFFVLWFANSIYGQIKPEFGGGYPTHAFFYLQQEIPTIHGKSLEVLVIDETEHGFYVIPKARNGKAVFIQRSLVMAVDFDSQPKVAEEPAKKQLTNPSRAEQKQREIAPKTR